MIDLCKSQTLEYSAPEIKSNITNFGVSVNNKLEFGHLFWVDSVDQIDISHWPSREVSDYSEVNVCFEDEDLLLLFKPAGIVVEKGIGHQKDNLTDYLASQKK